MCRDYVITILTCIPLMSNDTELWLGLTVIFSSVPGALHSVLEIVPGVIGDLI